MVDTSDLKSDAYGVRVRLSPPVPRNNMAETIYRFTASWCQPCKSLAKNLEEAALDATIVVVDIDVHPEMVETYGIRSVPTLVRASDYKKLIGVKSPSDIKDWFNS